jgi:hypothetical protein
MNIIDRFYSVSPIHDETSNFYKYIDAHEDELSVLEDEVNRIVISRQVNKASGSELDQIGKLFGDIGKRRGRDDDDYKIYLKTVVQSFRGRGTIPDMKFAVDNALFTGVTDVNIKEYFGEYIEEEEDFDSQSKGVVSRIPLRDDKNYINFYDKLDDSNLTINLVSGTPSEPSDTNEVNVNVKTGEWNADSSSDYRVTYDYREMLAYQIELYSQNWEPHSSESLINILELTDPSVSEFLQPIRRILKPQKIIVNASSTNNRTNRSSTSISVDADSVDNTSNSEDYNFYIYANDVSKNTKDLSTSISISGTDTSNQKVSEGLGADTIDNDSIS